MTVSMREVVCLSLAVVGLPCLVSGATKDMANVSAQYHSAGCVQLTGNTNLSALKKVLAVPSAAGIQRLALERISGLLADGLNLGTNMSAASLIEPLLSDAVETESLGSFGASATNALDFVLALRLDATRAQLWHDNFVKLFGNTAEKFTAEEFNGWRWKIGASDSFWIVLARDWLVVGRGDDLLPVQSEYLRRLSRDGRPGPALTDNWLEADLDCQRLAAWLPDWLQLSRPARIKIAIAEQTNNLHMTARVVYPEPIPWKSGSWQIPAGLVSGPLVSFTAGQNIAPFLNLGPPFSRLNDNPLTNQFYVWAQSGWPFLTYVAWPATNVTNALNELSTNATALFNPELKQFNGTELVWQPNRKKIALANLRVIMPDLGAVQDKSGEFLLASLFPRGRAKQAVPDDLWTPIQGRTNLVYYDWELTGPRLQEWRIPGRMLLTRWREPTDDVTEARIYEDKWLDEVARLNDNSSTTTTEITRVEANELSVIRNSPVGLTGVEVFLIFNWLSVADARPNVSQPAVH